MQTTSLEIVSFVFTYLVLAGVGYWFSGRFKQPVAVFTWVVIIIITILAAFVGIGTRLIAIFSFAIYLSWCLQAFCFGLIIGLLIKLIKFKLDSESEV